MNRLKKYTKGAILVGTDNRVFIVRQAGFNTDGCCKCIFDKEASVYCTAKVSKILKIKSCSNSIPENCYFEVIEGGI